MNKRRAYNLCMESELVSGFMTEHSAVIFVFFFLAEYASIVLICILTSIFFLGGYLLNYTPLIYFIKEMDLYLNDPYYFEPYYRDPYYSEPDYFELYYRDPDWENLCLNVTLLNTPASVNGNLLYDPLIEGIAHSLILGFKACVMIFVFIWARASLPRVRYDQLMSFCWTILLPLVIALIVLLPCILYGLEIIPTNVFIAYFVLKSGQCFATSRVTAKSTLLRSKYHVFVSLNSPPKPHAFVSLPVQLPVQSGLSSTSIPVFGVLIAISDAYSGIGNYNISLSIIYVVAFLLGVTILLCTEGGSSTNLHKEDEIHKEGETLKLKDKNKDKNNEKPPVLNVTYVVRDAIRAAYSKMILVDLNDASGVRLRLVWPQTSYKWRTVPVDGVMRTGLELPGRSDSYPEVQQPGLYTAIWVSAMINPNVFNFSAVTQGYPVITQPIAAYSLTTVGTGTGQTMKSLIRK